MQPICIAVDLMGGDLGPRSTLPACIDFSLSHPDIRLKLVGNQSDLELPDLPPNCDFIHTPDVVAMSDKPSLVLRQKRESSLWKVIELVSNGECQACVSAGNTGALMAVGRFVLKTFPGIDRPAICKYVPTEAEPCLALDLGANVDSTAAQLVQFALMGSVLAKALGKSDNPTVRLLNNGSEVIKGNEKIRLASSLMEEHDTINYQGYIEGDQIFAGLSDVVVCDGFVGNIALKVSEGTARFLANGLIVELQSSWWGKWVSLFAEPLLKKWHNKFDPSVYNGASFLGLQGTVVKSHGSADARSFRFALESSLDQVKHDVPHLISESLLEAYL